MSLLRNLFSTGPAAEWRQLADEFGGQLLDGGTWDVDRVQIPHRFWTLTLDTYTVSTGKSTITFTRLRAPFVNPGDLRFTVYRSNLFTAIGKALGMQDIEVGSPLFDKEFVVQGNQVDRVRRIFADERVAAGLRAQHDVAFKIIDQTRWFGKGLPEGVEYLTFERVGVVRDLEQLRGMVELLRTVLDLIAEQDKAGKDPFDLALEALRGPGGDIIESRVLLWDCDLPRCLAAADLGWLEDPRAVEPLMEVLDDPDLELRAAACRTLGRLGEPKAVPALIPLLGFGKGAVAGAAEAALGQLEQTERVEAFTRVLHGELAYLSWLEPFRAPFVEAFVSVLQTGNPEPASHAGVALAEWSTQEKYEEVRTARRRLNSADPEVRDRLDAALAALKTVAALPRPSSSAGTPANRLPLPSAAAAPPADELPRPTE